MDSWKYEQHIPKYISWIFFSKVRACPETVGCPWDSVESEMNTILRYLGCEPGPPEAKRKDNQGGVASGLGHG